MTVTFYNVLDDPRVLNKTLGNPLLTLTNVKLKDNVDVMNPILELKNDVNLMNANYFYITEWNKYYFKIPNETNNLGFIVRGKEDVRYTWKNEILQQRGIVSRHENAKDKNGKPVYNCFLNDNRLMVENRQLVTALKFPSGLPETDEIIMVVNGR